MSYYRINIPETANFKPYNQGVTKRCRLSLLTNSALVIRFQMRGEGGSCRVSANEYSIAHHVTWSPNKLWRSTSIFNLCLQPSKYACMNSRSFFAKQGTARELKKTAYARNTGCVLVTLKGREREMGGWSRFQRMGSERTLLRGLLRKCRLFVKWLCLCRIRSGFRIQ
jgi:hypothetical protein